MPSTAFSPGREIKGFDILQFVKTRSPANAPRSDRRSGRGLSAAARARRLDPGLEILVLEKGDTISYGACGLPFYIDGRVRDAKDLIVYTPEYFRKEAQHHGADWGRGREHRARAARVFAQGRRTRSLRPAG